MKIFVPMNFSGSVPLLKIDLVTMYGEKCFNQSVPRINELGLVFVCDYHIHMIALIILILVLVTYLLIATYICIFTSV